MKSVNLAVSQKNNDKAVSMWIDQCPPHMMLRELVQNGIESAMRAPKGQRVVRVQKRKVFGVDKLEIYNTGPGMDRDELISMSHLNESGTHKTMGLDGNFGMGAKVAALPSNPLGMVYRSCKNGIVHEMTMFRARGQYKRSEVVQIKVKVPTDHDWTTVTLLGARKSQNTVIDPHGSDYSYAGDGSLWVSNYLYRRWFRIPPGVEVTIGQGVFKSTAKTKKARNSAPFLPITDRINHPSMKGKMRREAVALKDVTIHFVYDPSYAKDKNKNASASLNLGAYHSMGALVFKNELYDVKKSHEWANLAPSLGITYATKRLSVFVELPDDSPFRPDPYRTEIAHTAKKGKKGQALILADYAELVRANLPGWVKKIIADNETVSFDVKDMHKELKELAKRINASTNGGSLRRVERSRERAVAINGEPVPRIIPLGNHEGNGSSGSGGGAFDTEASLNGAAISPSGTIPVSRKRTESIVPAIIPLKEKDAEDRGLTNRAAMYDSSTNQIIVNMGYRALDSLTGELFKLYPNAEESRSHVKLVAQKFYIRDIARNVMFCLSKHNDDQWSSDDVARALSPESITVHADDYENPLASARKALGRKFDAVA